MDRQTNLEEFSRARLGVFVHYGLYSGLARGEWVLNRERIPLDEYRALAESFTAEKFDADNLAATAKRAGAKYLCFTTMHHDGFALYDSDVNPFNSTRSPCGRDLIGEVVEACRNHGLRVHLYHSLNHWTTSPDGVDALQSESARDAFVGFAHERIRELLTRFDPIDCLWYDGWWPFNADGWRATEMNAMALSIQPHILFNGRNGLPGDFATPEQHLTAPKPYRPWEACVTHNQNWSFHARDQHWKSTAQIVDMITEVATGAGNLLLNIGPDGDGAIPQASVKMLDEVGQWLAVNGEAIYGSEPFTCSLRERTDACRGDHYHHGRYTARENTLFMHLFNWPGEEFTITGLHSQALSCRLLGHDGPVNLRQADDKVRFTNLPADPPNPLGGVLAVDCDRPPCLYLTGGMRIPEVPHPRYDPCPSDVPG